MNGTWKIASWEVGRNLRNKQFIVGLLLTPLLMIVFAGLPQLLERWNRPSVSTYYVIDEIGVLGGLPIEGLGNLQLLAYTEGRDSVGASVFEEKRSGYFILDEFFLSTGELEVFRNERNQETLATLRSLLSGLLQQARIQSSGINPDQLMFLTEGARLSAVQMDESQVASGSEIIVSMVVVGLLFVMIFSSGTMLMQSALQEKRDRMAEVVLSSVRPKELMQGKIIGHLVLAIIQLVVWVGIGLPVVVALLDYPILEALANTNLIFLGVFSLLGYALFAALFVGMGATMEDLQSAGNAQSLVIMIPMLAFIFLGPVISNPDGIIARFASLFPFTSPTIMIIRNVITQVPLWEIITSGVLLLITATLLTWFAAKVFRVGMLMYGKTASFPEIWKWIRHTDL